MKESLFKNWSVTEVTLADIANLDLYQFTKKFRSDKPVLLLIRFKHLPWTSVVKCAPVNMLLWGVKGISINLMDSFCWTNGLEDNKAIYDAFCHELKNAKISKTDVPFNLLGYYVHYDSYLGKHSLRFKGGFLGEFRLSGHLIPNEYVDDLISFYNQQLNQFGELSFLPLEEGLDDVLAEQLRSSIGKGIFSHPTTMDYEDEAELTSALNRQCDLVSKLISDISAGASIEAGIAARDMLCPSISYSTRRSEKILLNGRDYWMMNSFFPSKPLDVKLFGLRAKLIRLLGWPILYYSLSTMFDNWQQLLGLSTELQTRRSESHYCEIELASLINAIDNRAVVEFNFVEELLAFKSEMESRYPVLIADPLPALKS